MSPSTKRHAATSDFVGSHRGRAPATSGARTNRATTRAGGTRGQLSGRRKVRCDPGAQQLASQKALSRPMVAALGHWQRVRGQHSSAPWRSSSSCRPQQPARAARAARGSSGFGVHSRSVAQDVDTRQQTCLSPRNWCKDPCTYIHMRTGGIQESFHGCVRPPHVGYWRRDGHQHGAPDGCTPRLR